VARFVHDIQHQLRHPIVVVWDSIPIHHSDPMKRCLAMNPSIAVEPFPPYTPELNPVDRVWSYVKYGRLANYCPSGLCELRTAVSKQLTRLKSRPDLLRAFLDSTGLTL
jgi:putative transposase